MFVWWNKDYQNNLLIKFLALKVYFSSPSSDPLDLRRPAQAGVKDSYPFKSCYFTAIISCIAWERLQIDTDILLIITSNNDKLFIGVNVDDLEWLKLPK